MDLFDLVKLAVAGVLTVAVLFVLYRIVFARRKAPAQEAPSLAVDLGQVGTMGPPAMGPVLECYNIPVRLAVLVLAPVGRTELPATNKLPAILDQITPGLSRLLKPHGTIIDRWPPQLSPRGFAAAFFAQVKLPGDRGKGTPWCSLAGRVEGTGEGLLVGLALCAAAPNSLGQVAIERGSQWLDILRVKG